MSWGRAFPSSLHVYKAKTQISLHIHKGWSVFVGHFVCSEGSKATSGQQHWSACASQKSDQFSSGTLWVAKVPNRLQANSEDWSACADPQADLNLRWAHMQSSWKWCARAQIYYVSVNCKAMIKLFIPDFLKWTRPSLNLFRTIVPSRNISQNSKQNGAQCRS